jgi:hypothetical protein
MSWPPRVLRGWRRLQPARLLEDAARWIERALAAVRGLEFLIADALLRVMFSAGVVEVTATSRSKRRCGAPMRHSPRLSTRVAVAW